MYLYIESNATLRNQLKTDSECVAPEWVTEGTKMGIMQCQGPLGPLFSAFCNPAEGGGQQKK